MINRRSGVPEIGNNGFGRMFVYGNNLVPKPADNIKAFIFYFTEKEYSCIFGVCPCKIEFCHSQMIL